MSNEQLYDMLRRGHVRRLLACLPKDPERVESMLLYGLDDLPERLQQRERRALESFGVRQRLSAVERGQRDPRMIQRLRELQTAYENRVAAPIPMEISQQRVPKRKKDQQQQRQPVRRTKVFRFQDDPPAKVGSMTRPETDQAVQTRRQIRGRLDRILRQLADRDHSSRFIMMKRKSTRSDRWYIAAAHTSIDTLNLPVGLEIMTRADGRPCLAETIGARKISFHIFPEPHVGPWPLEENISPLIAFTYASNGRYLVPVNASTWITLNPYGFTLVRKNGMEYVEDHHLDIFHRLLTLTAR